MIGSDGTDRAGDWIDWPRPQVDAINDAMREAHSAFDRAYHHSAAATDLLRNVRETINALTRVAAILSLTTAAEPVWVDPDLRAELAKIIGTTMVLRTSPAEIADAVLALIVPAVRSQVAEGLGSNEFGREVHDLITDALRRPGVTTDALARRILDLIARRLAVSPQEGFPTDTQRARLSP